MGGGYRIKRLGRMSVITISKNIIMQISDFLTVDLHIRPFAQMSGHPVKLSLIILHVGSNSPEVLLKPSRRARTEEIKSPE